ncbi:MAG: hypothetical protein JEY99_12780 [Spirochaetales bacterium]|nr:hypothetical protein [Spirochaetales bacterium]
MTIKIRNTIFISSLSAAGIILVAFIAGSLYMLYSFSIPLKELLDINSVMLNLSHVSALLVFALISATVLLHSFRKTSAPEVFFILVFLLLLSTESLRLGLIYIQKAGLPFETGRTLSRVIYFGRFMGTTSIFISGLFACGIRNQRIEMLMGIGALISLSLATTIPLDNRTSEFSMIYTNSLNSQFFVVFMIIKVLSVWNYIYAGIVNNNRNYYFIGIGILMITAGLELVLNFQAVPFTGIGLLLMISGITLFGTQIHKIYLWF